MYPLGYKVTLVKAKVYLPTTQSRVQAQPWWASKHSLTIWGGAQGSSRYLCRVRTSPTDFTGLLTCQGAPAAALLHLSRSTKLCNAVIFEELQSDILFQRRKDQISLQMSVPHPYPEPALCGATEEVHTSLVPCEPWPQRVWFKIVPCHGCAV